MFNISFSGWPQKDRQWTHGFTSGCLKLPLETLYLHSRTSLKDGSFPNINIKASSIKNGDELTHSAVISWQTKRRSYDIHMKDFKMPVQLNTTTQATWGHSINSKLIPNGFSIQNRNEILHYCPNVKCKRKMISTWCRTLILKYSCVFSLTVENLLAISFGHSSVSSGYTTTRKVTTTYQKAVIRIVFFFFSGLLEIQYSSKFADNRCHMFLSPERPKILPTQNYSQWFIFLSMKTIYSYLNVDI